MNRIQQLWRRAIGMYADGFSNLPRWARSLWLIIFVKLFFMFAVLKAFFFPNLLKSNFDTPDARASHVIEQITQVNQ